MRLLLFSRRIAASRPPRNACHYSELTGSRSHTCAQLSAADAGKRVLLAGWILPERSAYSTTHMHALISLSYRPVSKSFSFFPLRDAYGATQLVAFRPKKDAPEDARNVLAELSQIPVESTVLVEGDVSLRPQNAVRPVRLHPEPLTPPIYSGSAIPLTSRAGTRG